MSFRSRSLTASSPQILEMIAKYSDSMGDEALRKSMNLVKPLEGWLLKHSRTKLVQSWDKRWCKISLVDGFILAHNDTSKSQKVKNKVYEISDIQEITQEEAVPKDDTGETVELELGVATEEERKVWVQMLLNTCLAQVIYCTPMEGTYFGRIKDFLRMGADATVCGIESSIPGERSKNSIPFIAYAVAKRRVDVAKVLFEAGADIAWLLRLDFVHRSFDAGLTSSSHTSKEITDLEVMKQRLYDIQEVILTRPARLNATGNDNEKWSILHHLAATNSAEGIEVVIAVAAQMGFPVDTMIQNSDGERPFHLALHARNVEAAKMFLNAEPKPERSSSSSADTPRAGSSRGLGFHSPPGTSSYMGSMSPNGSPSPVSPAAMAMASQVDARSKLKRRNTLGRMISKTAPSSDAKNKAGDPPIMYCIKHHLVELAHLLVDYHCDLLVSDRKGNSIMSNIFQCYDNDLETLAIRIIDELSNNQQYINRVDSDGMPPLLLAMSKSDVVPLSVLLAYLRAPALDINRTVTTAENPLMYILHSMGVSDQFSVEIMETILDRGDVYINVADKVGNTPLTLLLSLPRFVTCHNDHSLLALVLRILEDPGLNVNCVSPEGDPPVVLAVKNYVPEAIFLKLLTHPSLDINASDRNGKLSLAWALENSSTVSENILLTMLDVPSLDMSILDVSGHSMLTVALTYCKSEAVLLKILDLPGVDYNMRAPDGDAAFAIAIRTSFPSVPAKMINLCQNALNAPDRNGNTPLHLAILGGMRPLAESIVLAGGDTNAINHEGHTPMQLSLMSNTSNTNGAQSQTGSEENDKGRKIHTVFVIDTSDHMSADTIDVLDSDPVIDENHNNKFEVFLEAFDSFWSQYEEGNVVSVISCNNTPSLILNKHVISSFGAGSTAAKLSIQQLAMNIGTPGSECQVPCIDSGLMMVDGLIGDPDYLVSIVVVMAESVPDFQSHAMLSSLTYMNDNYLAHSPDLALSLSEPLHCRIVTISVYSSPLRSTVEMIGGQLIEVMDMKDLPASLLDGPSAAMNSRSELLPQSMTESEKTGSNSTMTDISCFEDAAWFEFLLLHAAVPGLGKITESFPGVIHSASSRGLVDVLRVFLRIGPYTVNRVRDLDGNTALHQAVLGDKVDAVALIVDMMNATTEPSIIPLDPKAASAAPSSDLNYIISVDVEQFKNLITEWDNEQIQQQQQQSLYQRGVGMSFCVTNNKGETALHLAARSGNVDIVQMLCQTPSIHNAIQMWNNNGFTPLHIAVQNQHEHLISLLLNSDHGVPIPQHVNQQALNGATALLEAVKIGNISIARALVGYGASLVPRMHGTWFNAVHLAVSENNLDMLRFLLEGSDVMLNFMVDRGGHTPLHLAAAMGYDALFTELLKAGADPRQVDYSGVDCIGIAVKQEDVFTAIDIQAALTASSLPPQEIHRDEPVEHVEHEPQVMPIPAQPTTQHTLPPPPLAPLAPVQQQVATIVPQQVEVAMEHVVDEEEDSGSGSDDDDDSDSSSLDSDDSTTEQLKEFFIPQALSQSNISFTQGELESEMKSLMNAVAGLVGGQDAELVAIDLVAASELIEFHQAEVFCEMVKKLMLL